VQCLRIAFSQVDHSVTMSLLCGETRVYPQRLWRPYITRNSCHELAVNQSAGCFRVLFQGIAGSGALSTVSAVDRCHRFLAGLNVTENLLHHAFSHALRNCYRSMKQVRSARDGIAFLMAGRCRQVWSMFFKDFACLCHGFEVHCGSPARGRGDYAKVIRDDFENCQEFVLTSLNQKS